MWHACHIADKRLLPAGKRRGGGIEPLHVSMPRELKSRPSTNPTHPGRDAWAGWPGMGHITADGYRIDLQSQLWVQPGLYNKLAP
jgi:hypothetical protein